MARLRTPSMAVSSSRQPLAPLTAPACLQDIIIQNIFSPVLTVTRRKTSVVSFGCYRNRNRNRNLLISRAPTKAKSQEPAYSQALNQNKIDRQRSRSRESGRQTVRRLWWMVFGVETGR